MGFYQVRNGTPVLLATSDIGGADLSAARGLTQAQLDDACANAATRLPPGLVGRSCRVGASVVVLHAPVRPGVRYVAHGERRGLNAARNTGGSIGVSLANNVLARREQFLLAPEMPVERHRGHAELGRELAHRQRVKPRLVDERERPLDHGGLGQAGPLAVVGERGRSHLTTIRRTGQDRQ